MASGKFVVTKEIYEYAYHLLPPDKNGLRKRHKITIRRAKWVDSSKYNPATLRKKPSSGANNGNMLKKLGSLATKTTGKVLAFRGKRATA